MPTPWHDHERLHGESLRELAAADPVAGRLDRGDNATARVRDLSLVDGRYAAPVIESVLLRLLDGWEQAALGRRDLLRRLATKDAIRHLLRDRDVRDLELVGWKVVRLDNSTTPVRLSLDVELRSHELRWILELLPGTDPLWRLAGSSDPRVAARG